MKNDFSEIKEGLSRKFEELLIEVSTVKTPQGFLMPADTGPILKEWIDLMDRMKLCFDNERQRGVSHED